MTRFNCVLLAAVLAGGAGAQNITRNFGSVVFPGGTSATNPNITRSFGSVVFPGGSPSSPVVRTSPAVVAPPVFSGRPFTSPAGSGSVRGATNSFQRYPNNGRGNRGVYLPYYGYPLYVPNYYDYTGAPPVETAAPAQPAQSPTVVIYQPQQPAQEVRPIIIEVGPDGKVTQLAQPPALQTLPAEPAAQADGDGARYLIAFKDHSIYSAVAYWFDGDTLHYFTRGDAHNQASVSLLDREMTERLNREQGVEFKMPAAK